MIASQLSFGLRCCFSTNATEHRKTGHDEQGEDSWGIKILYEPSAGIRENHELIDIVAVHGLMGNRIDTWTHKSNNKMWIGDFLPKAIPYARIMTYGYDANILSATTAGIYQTAQNLLRAIAAERTQIKTRKLILIGHSLGGLVIKKACQMLLHARAISSPVFKACYGVVFMAVPHDGATVAGFATSLVKASRPFLTVSSAFIQDLQRDSQAVQELTSDYAQIQHRFHYMSVQETSKTRIGVLQRKLIVNPNSSRLGLAESWEKVYPLIGRDHFQVCKFAKESSDSLRPVLQGIRELADGSIKPVSLDKTVFYMVRNTLSTRFRGRDDELRGIQAAFQGRPDQARRVALHGIGGIGKTQLALSYADCKRPTYSAVFFVECSTLAKAAADFDTIYHNLKLPRRAGEDPAGRVAGVINWLNSHSNWLLIFDNVQEDSFYELSVRFFPESKCHILITTRSSRAAHDFVGNCPGKEMEILEMNQDAAIELILDAGGLPTKDAELRAAAADVAGQLGYLPMALDFVGRGSRSLEALKEAHEKLGDLQKRYQFFEKHKDHFVHYKSGQLSFAMLYDEFIQRLSENVGRPLWYITAFLNPTWISAKLFSISAGETKDSLIRLTEVQDTVENCLAQMHSIGLTSTIPETSDYWIHDFVHEVNRSTLSANQNNEYSDSATRCVLAGFPEYRSFDHWELGRKYLDHAVSCTSWTRQLGLESAVLARLHYKASNYARFTGQFELAEILARQSLKILDAKPPGVTDEDMLNAQDSLAISLRRQSQWGESEKTFRASLDAQQRFFDSLDTFSTVLPCDLKNKKTFLQGLHFTTLNELGWMYFLKGEAAEAVPYLLRAKRGRVEAFGTNYGPTQHTNQNLAACYKQLGDLQKAEELYSEALDDHQKRFGDKQIWVMHIKYNLANLYDEQGRMEEAIDLDKKVLSGRREVLGETHPDVLMTIKTLVNLFMKAKRFKDAEASIQEAVAACQKELGDESEATMDMKDVWSMVAIKSGKSPPKYSEETDRRTDLSVNDHSRERVSTVNCI